MYDVRSIIFKTPKCKATLTYQLISTPLYVSNELQITDPESALNYKLLKVFVSIYTLYTLLVYFIAFDWYGLWYKDAI